MAAKFCKRQYRALLKLSKACACQTMKHDVLGLHEIECLRQSIATEFADMLKADSSAFQRERFLRACEPGANVRATSTGYVVLTEMI